MINRRLLIPGLCALFFFQHKAVAQPSNDACAWMTFNLSYPLRKSFKLFYTQEFRLKENLSTTNLTYSEAGIEFNPKGGFKTSFAYRFIQKYDYRQPVSFRHRLSWDLNYKHELTKWTFQYRLRLQGEVQDYQTSAMGHLPEFFWRNRISAKYELNKHLYPYCSIESRTQLSDPRNAWFDGETHRLRYQLGFDYKISKKQTVGAYYLIQDEFLLVDDQNLYVIGLEYSINL